MSDTADNVLGDLEQRALSDGISPEDLDTWVAGALGVPVACLHAYLDLNHAAERWRQCQSHRPTTDVLAVALPLAEAPSQPRRRTRPPMITNGSIDHPTTPRSPEPSIDSRVRCHPRPIVEADLTRRRPRQTRTRPSRDAAP